jgi:hypothetical protein
VSGKLFAQPAPRIPPALLGLAMLAAGALLSGGCRRPRTLTRPAAAVEDAVRPENLAGALQRLGRAHFRGTARFEAAPQGGAADAVTTETDIWMDDGGNWRLVELNDKDGGREIVRYGHELAVALRYGKMIRRPAEDPEPQHLLQEGVGAPFAAWDLLRDVSTVDDFGDEVHDGRKVHVYKITKARKVPEPPAQLDFSDRRAWRRTLVPSLVEGTVAVDEATHLPLQVEVRARYTMQRAAGAGGASGGKPGQKGGDGSSAVIPMAGLIKVKVTIEEIGTSPHIARPEAEDLPLRQRLVPDEKALLGGLPRSAPAPRGAP